MPATITFDHPSVSALTEFLAAAAFAEEIGDDGNSATPAPLTAPVATVIEFEETEVGDDLSDDELAARLAARLDSIMSED